MEVERFECQETIAEPIEASEEAIGIIRDLGLEGQERLVNPPTQEQPETRVPYRQIRADEAFVYQLLCPRQTKLKEFSACSIPLRVLQIAAHASTLDLFKSLWVWSAEGEVKDPVLIAQTEETATGGDRYILARWGEVLDAWPILAGKAMDLWRAKYREALAQIRARVENEATTLDDVSMSTAMSKSYPSFYEFV